MDIKLIIEKLKKWLRAKILPYRHLKIEEQRWDTQFSNGRWSYLDQLCELAHYSIIVG